MHYLYGNSDRCQPCVRCMEGVRNSEGPLWEVPLYTVEPPNKGHTRSESFVLCREVVLIHYSYSIVS